MTVRWHFRALLAIVELGLKPAIRGACPLRMRPGPVCRRWICTDCLGCVWREHDGVSGTVRDSLFRTFAFIANKPSPIQRVSVNCARILPGAWVLLAITVRLVQLMQEHTSLLGRKAPPGHKRHGDRCIIGAVIGRWVAVANGLWRGLEESSGTQDWSMRSVKVLNR